MFILRVTLSFLFFSFSDTPVILVQLIENPPWIKRSKGDLEDYVIFSCSNLNYFNANCINCQSRWAYKMSKHGFFLQPCVKTQWLLKTIPRSFVSDSYELLMWQVWLYEGNMLPKYCSRRKMEQIRPMTRQLDFEAYSFVSIPSFSTT